MNKTDKFIEKANNIHGNKYDYSKTHYINNETKICIICPVHGEFYQTPHNHTKSNNPTGCPKCGTNNSVNKRKGDGNNFIEKAKNIHGNKYDYSMVEYANNKTKVRIICPIHGEFQQKPNNHLNGQGCPFCGSNKAIELNKANKSLSLEDFINKSKDAHGDKYDYSKSSYVNYSTKICIICPEHGEFYQYPADHYYKKCGCPKCAKTINKSENRLFNFIKENIECEVIQTYKPSFLKTNKNNQEIDIFIPSLNIGIEYQGIQHFKPIKYWGGDKKLKEVIERDERKRMLCIENNIDLLYFTYEKLDMNGIFNNENKLLEYIKNKASK